MTTLEPDEQGKTAPIEFNPNPSLNPNPKTPARELPTQSNHETPPPSSEVSDSAPDAQVPNEGVASEAVATVAPTPTAPIDATMPVDGTAVLAARPAAPAEQNVTFVPLAVSIGDGFKFGCGFFLASVVALLIGFVLLAALFVLTGLFGLSLPLGR